MGSLRLTQPPQVCPKKPPSASQARTGSRKAWRVAAAKALPNTKHRGLTWRARPLVSLWWRRGGDERPAIYAEGVVGALPWVPATRLKAPSARTFTAAVGKKALVQVLRKPGTEGPCDQGKACEGWRSSAPPPAPQPGHREKRDGRHMQPPPKP